MALSTPIRISLLDHSNEPTSVNLHFDPVESDGSNWAELFANVTGKVDIVQTAVQAVTKLWTQKTSMGQDINTPFNGVPTDPSAQRESISTWIYQDDVTGKKYRFNVPGPVDTIRQVNTDEIDIAANVVAMAFVAIIEANCVSPDGNDITILRAYCTGRRA
jgi:hypothetical protein